VTFDADGQHRPEDIASLLEVQRETGADLVQGSRFLGAAVGMPASRRTVLRLGIWFMRFTSGIALSDTHNGLRLLSREAASALRISQNRMAHASEIIHQARRLGWTVAEAPVTIVYTDYSLSKGQKVGNLFGILAELIVARLNK
jgi:hypothetical protein